MEDRHGGLLLDNKSSALLGALLVLATNMAHAWLANKCKWASQRTRQLMLFSTVKRDYFSFFLLCFMPIIVYKITDIWN